MKIKCCGDSKNNCGKTWPDESVKWHHNTGLQAGDGETDDQGNYKMDYQKMCDSCYEKLSNEEKQLWPLI